MTVLKYCCLFFVGFHTRCSHPYSIHTNLNVSIKILYILLEFSYNSLPNIVPLEHKQSVEIDKTKSCYMQFIHYKMPSMSNKECTTCTHCVLTFEQPAWETLLSPHYDHRISRSSLCSVLLVC